VILLVVSGFLLASFWVARVESSSPALVFDRFRCHGQILATLLFHSFFHFLLAGPGLFLLALIGGHQVGAIGGHRKRLRWHREIVAKKKRGDIAAPSRFTCTNLSRSIANSPSKDRIKVTASASLLHKPLCITPVAIDDLSSLGSVCS
jgi:hypothetical protein